MNFNFIRNVHFTKLVRTTERLREFNFRLLPNTSNSLLHVDVPDDRGNRIQFRMQKEGNGWRVVDQDVPAWVTNNEGPLNEAIQEEIR